MRGQRSLLGIVALAAACGGRVDAVETATDAAGPPIVAPAYEYSPLAVSDARALFIAKDPACSTPTLRSFDRSSGSIKDESRPNETPEYVIEHEGAIYAIDGARGPVRRLVSGDATGQILASGPSQKAIAFNAGIILLAGLNDGIDSSIVVRFDGATKRRLFPTPEPRCAACLAATDDAVVLLTGRRASDHHTLVVGSMSGGGTRSIDVAIAGDGSPVERLLLRGNTAVLVTEQTIAVVAVDTGRTIFERRPTDPVRDGYFIGGYLAGEELVFATRTEFQRLRVFADGAMTVISRLPSALGKDAQVRAFGGDARGLFAIVVAPEFPQGAGLLHHPL